MQIKNLMNRNLYFFGEQETVFAVLLLVQEGKKYKID